MNDIWTSKQMEGRDATWQSKEAIRHTLCAIQENWNVGWHLGLGTQTFSLLTEAAASLFKQPIKDVRKYFIPVERGLSDSQKIQLIRQHLSRYDEAVRRGSREVGGQELIERIVEMRL